MFTVFSTYIFFLKGKAKKGERFFFLKKKEKRTKIIISFENINPQGWKQVSRNVYQYKRPK